MLVVGEIAGAYGEHSPTQSFPKPIDMIDAICAI